MYFDHLAQIKHRVWEGTINVRVVLEYTPNVSSESSSGSPSPSGADTESLLSVKEFLISVYRNSYVPTFLPLLVEYFSVYVEGLATIPVWLEYDETPLKWNLPVGVLYDTLTLPETNRREDSNIWTLHLRFKDQYPKTTIIPFIYTVTDDDNDSSVIDYAKSLHELMVNQLKQSCFVMNGTAKPMLNLSKEDSTKLWESIENHNLAHYNQVNKRICPLDTSLLLRVPVKVYIPGLGQTIQHPVSPFNVNGTPSTLRNVIEANIPQLNQVPDKKLTALIHGIIVDDMLDTPVIQFWDLFKYMDNFLHIVVF